MRMGVLDSGIGGITVLNELKKKFPTVEFIYFGDTAHVPYGTKSPQQIRKLTLAAARLLKKKKISALVIACNTATSWALPEVREALHPIPVFGVIEPGANAALQSWLPLLEKNPHSPLLVLATPATIKSDAYTTAIQSAYSKSGISHPKLGPILSQPCPLLVPMIEEGWMNHPILQQTVEEYVHLHRDSHPPGVALLGCTHYPWIQHLFQAALPKWTIVHSAHATAEALEQSPESSELKKKAPETETHAGVQTQWIFSDPGALPLFIRKEIQFKDIQD